MIKESASDNEQIIEPSPLETFMTENNIAAEDRYLIENIGGYERNNLIEFHNFFSTYKENSSLELANRINHAEELNYNKPYLQALLDFNNEYGYTVSWRLNRFLRK